MRQSATKELIFLFVFIVLSTGLAWPVNKIGLNYLSPLWYTAIRLLIGTATMTLIVVAMDEFKLPNKGDIPLIFTFGILQISVYIVLVNIGLTYLPAGRASLLAYTTPLWIMPAATIFFGESQSLLKWIGFFLGVAGLLVLISPWNMNWESKDVIFGTSMLLLASLSWAVSMLSVRYLTWTKSPLQLMPWQLFFGSIPVIIAALIKEPLVHIHLQTPLVLSLLYNGFLVTGLAYWSNIVINKALPTTVLSLGFLLVPAFSILISSFYLHETISATMASAVAMIVLGLGCMAF